MIGRCDTLYLFPLMFKKNGGMYPWDMDAPAFTAKINVTQKGKMIKSKTEFGIPFMVSDLVYKF